MYMPDKSHPSMAGTYLYGAVLYASLFGRTPEAIPYLGECEKPLPEETAAFLRGVALEDREGLLRLEVRTEALPKRPRPLQT